MPRKSNLNPPRLRNFKCRHVYHVYQRGSQRQNTFRSPTHLLNYLDRLDTLARRCKVRIHAFSLMSNHVHFLFEPQRKGAISRLMQHLQSQHARYMNGLDGTEGHLWRHHFHAKPVQGRAEYRQTLLFVEQEPTTANPTQQAHRYAYSSAAAHVANEPILTVIHKKQRVRVKLYLDRWRKEFEITPESNWAAWLQRPRQADYLKDLAAWIGKRPGPTIRLTPPDHLAFSARGS